MEPRFIITLITSLVASAIPIIIWLLNKREKNIFIERIEQQQKAHALIEELLKIGTKEHLVRIQDLKNKTIQRSIEILNSEYEQDAEKTFLSSKWSFKEYFLWFKPRNYKILCLQIIYWLVFLNIVSTVINIFTTEAVPEMLEEEGLELTLGVIISIGIVLFFIITLHILLLYYIIKYANRLQNKIIA